MTLAIIFPGQGSQKEGMLGELYKVYPQVKQRFEQASEVIKEDLWAIAATGGDGKLYQTAYTQPALLAASVACYDILQQELAIKASYLAGHSLGEYSALTVAGAISFSDAIELVHYRGHLMQDAVAYGGGAMAAIIGLKDRDVATLCHNAKGIVNPANFNAPEQVVIAGEAAAVREVIAAAKKEGAKRAIELPISVPSHCELMKGAAAKFGFYLNKVDWKIPKIAVIHNVDSQFRHNEQGIISALGAQLYKPVYWVSCIEELIKQGVDLFIEAGPNKVLTGLNKRIDSSVTTLSFELPEQLEEIAKRLSAADRS